MNEIVVCQVCPNRCHLKEGKVGLCGVRWARDGKVIPMFPHQVSGMQIDPMEKKPLYHFHPGKHILSIGTFGCTMNCGFCQNNHLLRPPSHYAGEKFSPENIIKICMQEELHDIAFTYNEPFVNYEFVMEVFELAKSKGLSTVLVTNGNVLLPVLEKVVPLVDAMNIDLKAFYSEFYKKQGGDLETVKQTIRYAVENHVHVEISFLAIPGENDDSLIFESMVKWLKETSENMVLHINRYYPARFYTLPPTPEETLLDMRTKALEMIPYVYIGNLPFVSNDTVCSCGEVLIKRGENWETEVRMTHDQCPNCHKKQSIIL